MQKDLRMLWTTKPDDTELLQVYENVDTTIGVHLQIQVFLHLSKAYLTVSNATKIFQGFPLPAIALTVIDKHPFKLYC